MNLLDALKWRYAVKRMNGAKIPAQTLDTIFKNSLLFEINDYLY